VGALAHGRAPGTDSRDRSAGTVTPGLLASGLLPIAVGGLLDRLSLARVVEVERAAGRLDELSPRENDVLDLMAQGLSNTAIADRLHLSIKTVEPAITSIFRKLGLDEDPASNRRVLAVVHYWSRSGAVEPLGPQAVRRSER
jgi:DNA-binding CsgD family transcriptional regulator